MIHECTSSDLQNILYMGHNCRCDHAFTMSLSVPVVLMVSINGCMQYPTMYRAPALVENAEVVPSQTKGRQLHGSTSVGRSMESLRSTKAMNSDSPAARTQLVRDQ